MILTEKNPAEQFRSAGFCILAGPFVKGLCVNSWGRGKIKNIEFRVGVKAPARNLCMGEENSVSEIAEVRHPEADTLQDFCFVVAALNKTV